MPLKRHYFDFQAQTGNQVTPDEVDQYTVYDVVHPAISATYIGSATAGTVSQVVAVGLAAVTPDYPRNLRATFTGSAALSGTVAVVGVNQFGATITENFGLAQGTQIIGTANGTQIFSRVNSATATFGTGAIGTGTVSLGLPIAGTACRFGLPVKIGSTNDLKRLTWTNGGLAVAVNGGTISTDYVSTTNHSFAGTATLAGTMSYQVWVKSTYKAKGDSMATISAL